MSSSFSRSDTLILLVKNGGLAERNPDVASVLLAILTSCSLHAIVAHDRWDHTSPEDHLKLLPALCYFSHCIDSRLALHFFHGVAYGTKWPHRENGEIVWHPGNPNRRSIWRVYPDESQPLPAQAEDNVRAGLVELAKFTRIEIGLPMHNANGSTMYGQRIAGTSAVIDFLRRSLAMGATLMHEISHGWWNAIHGHGEDERCFEDYPEQEIGLAEEWFVHRGSFKVDVAGMLTIRRLPSSGINEAYQNTTKQLSSLCRVDIEEKVRGVADGDLRQLFESGFWNGFVESDPLAPRRLI